MNKNLFNFKKSLCFLALLGVIMIYFIKLPVNVYKTNEEINQNIKVDLTSEKAKKTITFIKDYTKANFVYTSDFSYLYNGACAPVAGYNIMKYYEVANNQKIIEDNQTDLSMYLNFVENCKTNEKGGTQIHNMKAGIEKTFKERNVDINVKYVDFLLWYRIKREINNNRPLILANLTKGLEHAYVVVGYVEDNDTKAVITYTGWKSKAFEVIPINESEQCYYTVK